MEQKNLTREVKTGFFASAPLEALRLIISDAATRDQQEDKVIVVIDDVVRAFFEAPT